MSGNLKLFFRRDEQIGIRCAVVSTLIAFLGVGLAFLALPSSEYGIAVSGGVLVFIGLVLHFAINWRTTFLGDR